MTEAPSASPAETSPAETPSRQLGYQPALDGVRAIAVSLVVAYHYPWKHGINGAGHGGFLGVDVFFVLSGFLITTLLIQEHASHGAVSLRRFYARRALRLLPAFAVLWAIALYLSLTLAHDNRLRPQTAGLVGTLFYVANWVRIYDPRGLGTLLIPTWSLAVEEQFYLVWPVILILLFHLRVRLRTIAVITAAGALIAALHRASYWNSHVIRANLVDYYFRVTGGEVPRAPGILGRQTGAWDRVYFGSDTRADTLLVGCFTAIVLARVLPRLHDRVRARLSVASVFAFLVGAGIVSRAYYVRSGWLPRWGFAALEVCVAVVIVGLVAAPRAPLARVLAFRPLVWVGSRSYAIYLFNFLVFAYCNRSRVHLSPPLSFAFQIGLILLAAEVSYRLVEAPMLRRKRRFEPERMPSPRPVAA